MKKLFLIKNKDNLISGPFSEDQIKEMLIKGEIAAEHFLCQTQGYWFLVGDQEEFLNHFSFPEQLTKTHLKGYSKSKKVVLVTSLLLLVLSMLFFWWH